MSEQRAENGAQAQKSGLRDKLLRSHMTVVAIALGTLLIALGCVWWLRHNVLKLTQNDAAAVMTILDAQFGFWHAHEHLAAILAKPNDESRQRWTAAWEREIEPHLAQLGQLGAEAVNADQRKALDRLVSASGRLHVLQRKVQEAAERASAAPPEAAAEAKVIFDQQVAPLEREIFTVLHGIAGRTMRESDNQAMFVSLGTTLVTVLLVGLLAEMMLVAVSVSRRAAERIAAPVLLLNTATRELAAGRLDADVPVAGDDEIAQLTRAFNTMRAELARRAEQIARATDNIRRTAEEVADAVTGLAGASSVLFQGAERHNGEIASVKSRVADLADTAGHLAIRARTVAEKSEWTVAIGMAGRESVEESRAAMAHLRGDADPSAPGGGAPTGNLNGVEGTLKEAMDAIGQADDTIKTLVHIASEGEQLAVETAAALQQQASWLGDIREAMDRSAETTRENFSSTENVVRVSRELDELGAELRALLRSYDA